MSSTSVSGNPRIWIVLHIRSQLNCLHYRWLWQMCLVIIKLKSMGLLFSWIHGALPLSVSLLQEFLCKALKKPKECVCKRPVEPEASRSHSGSVVCRCLTQVLSMIIVHQLSLTCVQRVRLQKTYGTDPTVNPLSLVVSRRCFPIVLLAPPLPRDAFYNFHFLYMSYILLFIFYILHFTFCIRHFIFFILHFTFGILHDWMYWQH